MNAQAARATVHSQVTEPWRDAVPFGDRLSAQAGVLARAAAVLAERFGNGGMALVHGIGPGALTARAIAADLVRPAAPCVRALPALALDAAYGDIARQVRRLANPCDVMISVMPGAPTDEALAPLNAAAVLGVPVIAFTGSGDGHVADVADHVIVSPSTAPLPSLAFHAFAHGLLEDLVRGTVGPRPLLRSGLSRTPDERLTAAARHRAAEVTAFQAGIVQEHEAQLAACAAVLVRAFSRRSRLFVVDDSGGRDAADVARAFTVPAWEDGPRLPVLSPQTGTSEPGDVTLALLGGHDTAEMVSILAAARWKSQLTVALTGPAGAALTRSNLADHLLVLPADTPRRLRESHLTWCSALWDFTHRALLRPRRRS